VDDLRALSLVLAMFICVGGLMLRCVVRSTDFLLGKIRAAQGTLGGRGLLFLCATENSKNFPSLSTKVNRLIRLQARHADTRAVVAGERGGMVCPPAASILRSLLTVVR
jgi:hypothetical protein